MSKPANRLLTLILLLQRQPNQKASELAGELGVSVRTLHRYMRQLDEMGIPVYSERGPYGGFSLVRGYKMPPLIFSSEEAVVISLGSSLVTELWGPLYEQAARSAIIKLNNVLPDEQRQQIAWARRSLLAMNLHHPSLDVLAATLEVLRGAIRETHPVEMVYTSASAPEARKRALDPYALVNRWGWWYLVGYCHNHQEIRTFRIDRIQSARPLAGTFQVPDDFEARVFMEREFQGQALVQARLRFSAQAAHLARINRSSWDLLEEQADGSVVVTMQAPDLKWAAGSILMYGPAVEVLGPQELRTLVGEWVRLLADRYPEQAGEHG